MVDDLTFRPIADDEPLDALFDLDAIAFHAPISDAQRVHSAAVLGRRGTLCAFDGSALVGSSVALDQRLSIPGGELRCAAITYVSVLPTHRRRGILRRMIEGQLARAREAGIPIAALWASEATIYGRFGFGPATRTHDLRIATRNGRLRSGPAPERVRMIDLATAANVLAPIFERARVGRPGMLSREPIWWTDEILADPEDERGELGPKLVVVTGEEPDGYAVYRSRREAHPKDEEAPEGILQVDDLVATNPTAERSLWSFLLSIDLVRSVEADCRPVDDPLIAMLDDPRVVRRVESDAVWLRLLDLPGALGARSWAAEVDLTLEVADDLVAENDGRWRLQAGPDGATCVRTDRAPDLVLGIRDLGGAYLGGYPLVQAVAAGVVEERSPGAAAALDFALRTPVAPWAAGVF